MLFAKLCLIPVRRRRRPTGRAGLHTRRLVLGIESSCDDTGIAIVSSDREILSNVLMSQDEIHGKFQGVVPSLAAQAHRERIDNCIKQALDAANLNFDMIDAVSVTKGPGLAGCLAVGLNAAKSVVQRFPGIQIVAVNHMEGHALVPRLADPEISFPFLALLISGGHTQLIVCKNVGDYSLLGDSLDDAIGECIDKVARGLSLEFRGGGGKAVEALAARGTVSNEFDLQVPLKRTKNCDFSFSGLKTACLSLLEKNPEILSDEAKKANFAATFQSVLILHLSDRVTRAAQWCRLNVPAVKHLVLSGGVACNMAIRNALSRVAEEEGLRFKAPPPSLCTDNGVMIAWAGIENLAVGKEIVHDLESLRYVPRLPLDPSGTDFFPGSHVSHNSSHYESSIIAAKSAIKKGDDKPGLFFSIARDLSRLQKHEEAIGFCRQGLEKHPNNKFLTNLLKKLE